MISREHKVTVRIAEGHGNKNKMPLLKLRNHIPIAGPARREPADGSESDMRVSIGFEPAWFHKRCRVNFGEQWHKDPFYRHESLIKMKAELVKRFPSVPSWNPSESDDLWTISGVDGIHFIQTLFNIPLIFEKDRWPVLAHEKRWTIGELEQLTPETLMLSPSAEELFRQMETIKSESGKIHGYMNWQGVLNNAYHLRGQDIFTDFYERPEFIHHLFSIICEVMIGLAQVVQEKQRASGFDINQLSVSNCMMNMISPEMYREFVFPHDKKIALSFKRFGVHTCNWKIDPYIGVLGELPKMGYLDMGTASDLAEVKRRFPDTRRAVIYSPMALHDNPVKVIQKNMTRIYHELAPCDVVVADIQHRTPDHKVNDLLNICRKLEENQNGPAGRN